ncbi:TonB-dependent receptor [Pseudoduganella sp.]|uniref:TonB-dependent receptor n=1 Tax=Pseudoduganella sp. TaxID=1880898 RepID=UPI0035ADB2BF
MQHRRIQPHALALAAAAFCSHSALAADTELPMIVVQSAAAADPLHGTSSATRLEVALRDVPQSVQFVDQALIQEQGALAMKDVLRNVSGVAPAQGEGRRDQFYIRGFDATRDTLLDGMRDDSLYFRDLGNVERIEVLKGPAAVLFGRGSAGGVINRVTKKPVRTPLREVTLRAGSDNLRRLDLDLGGAAGEHAAFRLTAAYEAGDSYRDVVHSERTALAPSIAWTAGRGTSFLLQTEFLHQRRTPDRGIPSQNGAPADVPVGNFYGERYDFATTDAHNARFSVEHAVNDRLKLRNNFQYSKLELDAINTRTLGLTAANTQVRRQITYFPQDQTNFLNQTEAVLQFEAGGAQHTVVTGVEFGHQESGRLVRAATTAPVSLLVPQQLMPMPDLAALPTTIDNDFKADTVAWYAQDQVSLGEQWKMLAGVRADRFWQEQNEHRSRLRQRRTDSVWSPRIGVVYQPGQAHALYANVSRSFVPVGNDFFYGGQDFAQIAPVESLQKEIGSKSEWLGGRLLSTAAVYQITQRNVATKDPTDPAGVRQVQTGEQQSRGFEIDLMGKLAPDWKVFANATVNHARITRSNNYAVGNRPANIPKHAAGVWSSYTLGQGMTFGAGAYYVGERFAVEDNAVRLPAYVRLDAMLGYQSKHWEAGINLHNLANKVYYESANNNFQIQPGAPRSIAMYLRIKT